jgi:uncharacterized protein
MVAAAEGGGKWWSGGVGAWGRGVDEYGVLVAATVSIKVVPGASRDRVVGRYGDAVKVQVSAPPEGGKANKAVLALLAAALGVRANQLRLVRGATQSRKLVEVDGLPQAEVDARLAALTAA